MAGPFSLHRFRGLLLDLSPAACIENNSLTQPQNTHFDRTRNISHGIPGLSGLPGKRWGLCGLAKVGNHRGGDFASGGTKYLGGKVPPIVSPNPRITRILSIKKIKKKGIKILLGTYLNAYIFPAHPYFYSISLVARTRMENVISFLVVTSGRRSPNAERYLLRSRTSSSRQLVRGYIGFLILASWYLTQSEGAWGRCCFMQPSYFRWRPQPPETGLVVSQVGCQRI